MDVVAKTEEAGGVADHELVTLPPVGAVQQALALVREAIDQLSAEVEAEAKGFAGPELRLQQALALPRRAATLRDLSIALRELVSLERGQLSLDRPRGEQLLKVLMALVASTCPSAAVEEPQTDGK